MTSGFGSVSAGERLTAQMASHCGHQRNRLSLRIMRTSTGEQRQAGHGTATSSGLSKRRIHGSQKSDLLGQGSNRAGRGTTRAVAWSSTRPLASARPPHEIRRSTCNASVSMCRDSQARATWRSPVTGTAGLSLAGERLRDDRRARTGAGCLWSRHTARGGEVHPQGQQQVWGPSRFHTAIRCKCDLRKRRRTGARKA
jgi:hypothetical protein